MPYYWKDEWATGNANIDTQHKQLFKAINDLLEACSSGQGRVKLSATMQFLIDYTDKHFGDEEKMYGLSLKITSKKVCSTLMWVEN